MAMGKVLTVCVLAVVTMSLMAWEVQGCSLQDLKPCLNAVTQPNVGPSPDCCRSVAAVDVPCFCNLVAKSNYGPAIVDRAIKIPAACGDAAYAHFKGKNCAGHVVG